MSGKVGYICPIKGCPCKKKWFPSITELVLHLVEEHGEETVAKRLRVKPVEKALEGIDIGIEDSVYPNTVKILKNNILTTTEVLYDKESLRDFIERTTSMESMFGFEIEVIFATSAVTEIHCISID